MWIHVLIVVALLMGGDLQAARAAAGCLSIAGSTLPVALGATLTFGAQCCSAVPALPGHWWILAALLLIVGVVFLRRAPRLASGLSLLCAIGLFVHPAYGQACGGPFQWQAQSATELFTGTGASFAFTPTAPGTFVISLTDSAETAPYVTVRVVCAGCLAIGDSVLMHHNNLSRNGLYVQPKLTKTAAAGLHLDTTFTSASIIGEVYAQPLFVDGGSTGRDLVIVSTEANNVYAMNASTGALVWMTNLGTPVPLANRPCGNIEPFGITSTPVIDWPSRTLFVGSTAMVGTTTEHLIFALSIDSGVVSSNWPVDVGTTAVSGSTTFSDAAQGDRGALALLNGTLYAVYGGLYGDCSPYQGWVVSVPIAAPSQVHAWATTASGGGIWAPAGASSDGTFLYASTGNTFGANVWGGGEAVFRFTPGTSSFANPTYWTPTNWKTLDNEDLDLGGTTPIPFSLAGATPSKLVLALGKDGNAYLVDPANLLGVGAPLAQAKVASNLIIGAAAVYTTAMGTYATFKANGLGCTSGAGGDLTTIKLGAGSPPTIAGSWCATQGGLGSPMVTTTDGISNAIVWSVGAENSQQLHGFDGDTGASIYPSGTTTISGMRRYNSPIAAKGRIFVAGDSGVVAFTP
jgi:outer membrane protein assembly factor BamB